VNYHDMTKSELVAELEALNASIDCFVFDRNGVVRAVNANGAALLGLDRRAVVGKPFVRFVDESDAEVFAAHLRRALASEERVATDLRLRAGRGVRHVRLESTQAGEGDGVVVRTIALDITDRKQLEDQLLHAQRMEAIGRLAGGIAHDFNNMLMAILGHTELLLIRLTPADPMRASIETIQATAERAAALTRQLVTFSRKQVISPRVLSLNTVVTDMNKMLRRLIGEDVEVVYALDPALGSVRIDPTQAEQIVMNLAVNARDAMPKGGRLTIRTSHETMDEERARWRVDVEPGEYVELSVADTGIGMDEQTLARIFEPFFTTKVQGKGTGLGLSTVYAIVQQNNGHLEVESEPGRGTTFVIRLPRVAGAVAVERPVEQPELPRGTETVLVVEDDDTVRELVCQMLRTVGYTVLEARHGGEALLICERTSEPIDLMVTDVVMPQMSGRQLAERLEPLQPEMKVLFMSGHTDDAVIRHGVRNAMMTFIQKPFTPAALTRQVRAVLDN
jgi:two-component system cell cycle sensor histidine kinase/response regulator CckA